jgi:hypothetical protein
MWIILKDRISDVAAGERSAVGVRSCNHKEGAKLPYRFRLLDDDGEVYYEGRMSELDFDPLDDYGMPNAGCTELQYREGNGPWTRM